MEPVAGRSTTFIKMMILDYAEQLEVPRDFWKPRERSKGRRFGKRMERLAEGEYQLRVSGSGGSHCWIVETEKDRDSLYFRKGWPGFVEDNNVRFADVLKFIYRGGNKFLVKIFNPSGSTRSMVLIVDASNGGNEEGEDEPMKMDPDKDDGEGDKQPFSMDLGVPPIYYITGNGECHLEVGSMEPAKDEGLDCMEVEEEKEKEIHEYAAPMQKGNLELDFCAMNGEIKVDAARPSQNKGFPRFEEKKERRDFAAQTRKEISDMDTSAMKEETEQGQTQKESPSCLDEERETHKFAAPIRKESFGLDFFARNGERKEGFDGQYQKESGSHVEEGKEHVKESSVLPPFSLSNTHFTATWQPSWQHCLTIPKEIAIKKDLNSKSQIVIRDHKGGIWFMKLSTDKDGTINITDDWSKFCRGFGLKEGDSCTFEFFSSRIVHVHISAARSKALTGQ